MPPLPPASASHLLLLPASPLLSSKWMSTSSSLSSSRFTSLNNLGGPTAQQQCTSKVVSHDPVSGKSYNLRTVAALLGAC